MENNILTAKEWLEKEGINVVGSHSDYMINFMESYANYRNSMLEAHILYFYGQLATIAKGEYYEGILEDIKNQYVDYFNIEIQRQGKIN